MGSGDASTAVVIAYCGHAAGATFVQVGILLGPALLLGLVMQLLARTIQGRAYRAFGSRRFLLLFGWLGTIVHEASHALACVVFRHRITSIKWFDPVAADGALGFVSHEYDPTSAYQLAGNFFIGVAPLIGGTLFVYHASQLLIGTDVFAAMPTLEVTSKSFGSLQSAGVVATSVWHGAQAVFEALLTRRHVLDWKFFVFLFVCFSVGSSITLSRPDLKGAASGLAFLIGALMLFNLATVWMGDFLTRAMESAAHTYSVFYVVMIFALVVNGIVAALVIAVPTTLHLGRSVATAARGRRARGR